MRFGGLPSFDTHRVCGFGSGLRVRGIRFRRGLGLGFRPVSAFYDLGIWYVGPKGPSANIVGT